MIKLTRLKNGCISNYQYTCTNLVTIKTCTKNTLLFIEKKKLAGMYISHMCFTRQHVGTNHIKFIITHQESCFS